MTMQESKKYMLTGLIGLIIVGIAAFFLMREQKLPQSIHSPIAMPGTEIASIFSVVPVGYDQLIYIRGDKDILSALQTIDPSFVGAEYTALVEQLDYALLVQYVHEDNIYDLLFLEGENIDIAALQQVGLLAEGDDLETAQLTDTFWVYGSSDALAWRKKAPAYLHTDTDVTLFSEQFYAGKYSIGFMSVPRPIVVTPLVNQFAQQLHHTMVFSRLTSADIVGKVIMQFSDGVIHERSTDFSPRLTSLFPTDALAYIEMSDILGFFGVTEEDFMSIAPVLIGQQQGGVYSALLQQEDYQHIYDALYNHMAIGLVPSQGVFGIGAYMIFDEASIYDTLVTLSPLWTSLLSDFAGGTGSVEQETENEGIVWMTDSFMFAGSDGQQQPMMTLTQQDDATIVSLATIYDKAKNGSGIMIGYEENTVLTFSFENKQLQQLIQSQHALLGETVLPDVTTGLSRLMGNVQSHADKDQIVIDFSVE